MIGLWKIHVNLVPADLTIFHIMSDKIYDCLYCFIGKANKIEHNNIAKRQHRTCRLDVFLTHKMCKVERHLVATSDYPFLL